MGETLSLFRFSFNNSLRIESRPERLTGEPGAMLLREIVERTRIIEWLTERLHGRWSQKIGQRVKVYSTG